MNVLKSTFGCSSVWELGNLSFPRSRANKLYSLRPRGAAARPYEAFFFNRTTPALQNCFNF